jgi:spermidine/putrescine transport system substrate-binding protein
MTTARRTTPPRPVTPSDAAWIRGMTQRRFSRRDFLRYTGTGAAGLGAAWALAACGTSAQSLPTVITSMPPTTGTVNVANWIAYIDSTTPDPGTVLGKFQDTGEQISYKEDIGDNDEFFGTDLRQQLSDGQPTGWDIVTMTDWMIAKLISLGWVVELDKSLIPNCVNNLDPKWHDVYFDPGRKYSYPWAAGITGIGYNRSLVGRDITSVSELFSDEFAGRVGMFKEVRDSMNFALLADGVKPDQATEDQIDAAFTKLEQQRDAGIVRAYYGNDYLDVFSNGDLAVTMAWSGDINALEDENLKFIVPTEGGNRWSDNMVIPALAEHPADAHAWMNFVYDVGIATQITEYVWYESPVAGVQAQIQADAEEDPSLDAIANSEVVWPTPEVEANTYGYINLDEEAEKQWHDRWDPLILG